MGVSVGEIINALQVYFGSLYVNDFNLFGRTWQVNVQADVQFRKRASDLNGSHDPERGTARWCPVGGSSRVKDTDRSGHDPALQPLPGARR